MPHVTQFEQALAAHPAPTRLGDVALRYEPSLLIGETDARPGTSRPTALLTVGGAGLLGAVVSVSQGWLLLAVVALAVAAAGFFGSVTLSRQERLRRSFVLNFSTVSLRLDFATALSGHARTLVVPFDAVTQVQLVEQADGAHCVLVDFRVGEALLREVLSAFIRPDELGAARRFTRVLEGAFGLGSIPPGSPYLATLSSGGPSSSAVTPGPGDSFEP
jgi:hypothetical protein